MIKLQTLWGRHALNSAGERGVHPEGLVDASLQILELRELVVVGRFIAVRHEALVNLVLELLVDLGVARQFEERHVIVEDVVSLLGRRIS